MNPRGRDRFRYIEAALASSELSPGEKVLAARLGLHCNDVTGRCNPSFETLAKGIAVSVRQVKRLKRGLKDKKWVQHLENLGGARDGKGISNNYLLLMDRVPAEGATVTTVSPLVSNSEGATVTAVDGNGDIRGQQGCQPRHSNNKDNNNENQDICSTGFKNAVEGEGSVDGAEQTSIAGAASSAFTDAELDQEFEEFWKQCCRRVSKGNARAAYLKIVIGGTATPGELLRGMMIYSAARQEADQRYTKTPTKWLTEECWHDDPDAIAPKSPMAFASYALKNARKAGGSAVEWPYTQKATEPPPTEPVPEDPRWARIRQALQQELEAITFNRYFRNAEFMGLIGTDVALAVAAPVDARQVTANHSGLRDLLIKHWQSEEPSVRTVTVFADLTVARTGT